MTQVIRYMDWGDWKKRFFDGNSFDDCPLPPIVSPRITDLFRVGDKVSWVKVEVEPKVKVTIHNGTIKAIEGSRATIDSPQFETEQTVSLFELEVIQAVENEEDNAA